MATDVSIAFKASDKLSDSIRGMQKNVKSLSRDIGEYKKIADQAFDKRKELKLDITKAKTELKELERAYKQGDETVSASFAKKQKQLDMMNEEYRRLGRVIKDAGNAEKNLADDISRNSNKYASRTTPDLVNSLKNAGLGAMLGNATSGLLGQIVTSSFGTTTGSVISDITGGVATGAAMGSIGGIGPGTVIGGAVGGLTGAINSLTKQLEKKDDIFRGEVKDIYTDIKNRQEDSLQRGIKSASKMEQNMISYSTLLNGEENAKSFLTDIQQFSAVTPFQQEPLLNTSKILLSYGFGQEEIIPMMTKIGDTGAALGMSPDDIDRVAISLGRMRSSGKTTLEYLNPLVERGVPAIEYLKNALDKNEGQIYDMISKSQINGKEAYKIIVDGMGKQYKDNMEKQSKSYEGMLSTVDDLKLQIDMAMGKGFTEEVKLGLEKDIEAYGGVLDEDFKTSLELIGKYRGALENEHREAVRKALEDARNSKEYKKAFDKNDEREMSRILDEAYANAEAEYKNSDRYKNKLEDDLQLVKDIQEAVVENGAYLEYGKKMGEQFSKGYNSIVKEKTGVVSVRGGFGYRFVKSEDGENGHATGLDRVPHDDYFAKLHEGERVLTRLQADELDRKESKPPVSINLTVNAKTGDPYELAQVLYSEIKNAMENLVDNS